MCAPDRPSKILFVQVWTLSSSPMPYPSFGLCVFFLSGHGTGAHWHYRWKEFYHLLVLARYFQPAVPVGTADAVSPRLSRVDSARLKPRRARGSTTSPALVR